MSRIGSKNYSECSKLDPLATRRRTIRPANHASDKVQLLYGSGKFPVNGVECTTATAAVLTEGGRPYKYRTRLSGRGQLLGSSVQELSRLQLEAELVFGQVGGNFVLLDDNGAATSIRLLSTGAEFPGVVVNQFAFPESRGGELVTGRTFTFDAEATYMSTGAAGAIINYQESVEINGNGGPKVDWQNAFNGPLVPVRTFPTTITVVVQSGMATGYLIYPTPPRAVLPTAYLQNPLAAVKRQAPRPNGTEYSISWRYVFHFPGPLSRSVLPNVYIG